MDNATDNISILCEGDLYHYFYGKNKKLFPTKNYVP